MANTIKRDVDLGITNAEGKRGILTLQTGKGFRGGVRSSVQVGWQGDGFRSHLLFGDFSKCLKTTQGTATQKAIDTQHAAVFTLTAVDELVAEAKAFYDVCEECTDQGETTCKHGKKIGVAEHA